MSTLTDCQRSPRDLSRSPLTTTTSRTSRWRRSRRSRRYPPSKPRLRLPRRTTLTGIWQGPRGNGADRASTPPKSRCRPSTFSSGKDTDLMLLFTHTEGVKSKRYKDYAIQIFFSTVCPRSHGDMVNNNNNNCWIRLLWAQEPAAQPIVQPLRHHLGWWKHRMLQGKKP